MTADQRSARQRRLHDIHGVLSTRTARYGTRRGRLHHPRGDATPSMSTKARWSRRQTVDKKVMGLPEQSLGGAMNGQPRPHADRSSSAAKTPDRGFRIEPNGRRPHAEVEAWTGCGLSTRLAKRARRCPVSSSALEKLRVAARYPDPGADMAYNNPSPCRRHAIDQRRSPCRCGRPWRAITCRRTTR